MTPPPSPPIDSGALVAGTQGLPKIVLAAADGARFEAYLHGAQVTSWRPAGETDDRLFLSTLARFAPDSTIRGGVPVSFPQFADQGPLPMHGFVRDTAWELTAASRAPDGAARAQFRLADSPRTRALWPHAFACELTVQARGACLTIELAVTNTGTEPFAFTMALHTYLRVADVRQATVRGLNRARYRDKVLGREDVVETNPELAVDRPLDRVYRIVPAALEVSEPGRRLTVSAAGTLDTVLWNPGPPQGAGRADLAPDAWRSLLCVEAAIASRAWTLAPRGVWRGSQTLTARS